MRDIVIKYEWASRTNDYNNCIVLVNMTQKKFYIYKRSLYKNEKYIELTNNTNCEFYFIDLKDKASFEDLVKAMRRTDFEEV